MRRKIACKTAILLSVLLLIAGCDETNLQSGDTDGETESFRVFTTADGLADNAINDMALDYARQGVWFATGNGVSFYSSADSTFYTWGSDSGLPELKTNTIAYDPLGYIWSGSEAGIALFDSVWTYQADMGGHSSQYITDIAINNADLSVWFGTQNGIAVKELAGWTSYIGELALSAYVTSLEIVSGKVWIGTRNGIVVFDSAANTWTAYDDTYLPSAIVNTVLSDGMGTIWAGTASVAAAFNGSAWTAYGEADGLDSYGINDFALDSYGTIWAATDGGVYTFTGSRWGKLSLPSEVEGSRVISVLYDSINDAFWFGTRDGVVRYDTTTGF